MAAELGEQQKDDLCGAFHAARVLREAGVTSWDGERLDQDLVARHAGTLLAQASDGAAPELPPGARPRTDYRFALELAEAAASGTSSAGLAEAIERLSAGVLACVPARSSAWSGQAVEGLLSASRELDARLLANVRTGRLWGTRAPAETLLAELEGERDAPPPPEAEWDVGHFVELVALLRGRRGSLVLVRDSYPSLGWHGHHLQPPAAVASALARDDGREGGVLIVLATERRADAAQAATALALETEMWNNGSRR
jgi:hypothetical protein